jgi:hypothetical protein
VDAYLQSAKNGLYCENGGIVEIGFAQLEIERQKMCEELLGKVKALRTILPNEADWSLDIVGDEPAGYN